MFYVDFQRFGDKLKQEDAMLYKNLKFAVLLFVFCTTFVAHAEQNDRNRRKTHSYSESYESHSRYDRHGTTPWDFSGMLGLYNPGVGFGVLAAYRVTDSILPHVDQSLSVESGLNFISVSDNLAGSSISYSLIEIPIQARWDFYMAQGKLLVGPRAGFDFLTGTSVTVNGVSYSIARSGGLYFQIGGSAIYYFSPQFGVRANLSIGGYTTLAIGVNYAL